MGATHRLIGLAAAAAGALGVVATKAHGLIHQVSGANVYEPYLTPDLSNWAYWIVAGGLQASGLGMIVLFPLAALEMFTASATPLFVALLGACVAAGVPATRRSLLVLCWLNVALIAAGWMLHPHDWPVAGQSALMVRTLPLLANATAALKLGPWSLPGQSGDTGQFG
jgi:hypothetical protein